MSTAEAFTDAMSRKYADTEFSGIEIFMLGEALLSWVSTIKRLGHTNPSALLDYTHPTGVIWHDILRDFVAWTSGRTNLAPGCADRLRDHAADSGWDDFVTRRMVEALRPALEPDRAA